VQIAGLGEGAVLSEILDEAGDLASAATLRELARRQGFALVSIAAIAAHEQTQSSWIPARARRGRRRSASADREAT
jgi:3,4-dihydroxy-2-butanone 4-phosphate synthase